jgi:predicted transcriptional regulator
MSNQVQLSKRERQVMDILYQHGAMPASAIQEAMPDAPTNSAVRSVLRLLTEKGHVTREQDGFRYLYAPAVTRGQASRSALKGLLKTFFDGSPRKAFVELLDLSKTDMAEEDWAQLSDLIEQARKEDR